MDQPESEKTGSRAGDSRRWRWLGVEFLVIALGVFAALAVDTWVEERENAEREADYRQRLAVDLQRDVSNLSAVVEYYGRVREHGLIALGDLDGVHPLDDFMLMFAAFNAAEEWGFQVESSTYNDLQSTGALSLIRDVQFRIDLADYYRQAKARGEQIWNLSREYRALARGIIPDDLQVAIHASCVHDLETPGAPTAVAADTAEPLSPASVEPMTGSAAAQDLCGLVPVQFDVTRAAAELRADPQVRRLLRFRVSELRVANALFDDQRGRAEELLERLGTAVSR